MVDNIHPRDAWAALRSDDKAQLVDVRTDAERGRVYLPLSELARFEVTPEEILRFEYSERYHRLAISVAEQARRFYELARVTLPETERPSMVAAELMAAVYWRLLNKIESKRFNVFGAAPIRLGKPAKLALIADAWLRQITGRPPPG